MPVGQTVPHRSPGPGPRRTARVNRAASATPPSLPVAVFDMDGVLVHGDVFGSFVRHRLRRSPAHLAAVAGAWPWLAGPILLRRTRRVGVRELLRIALAGLDDAGYERAARAFGAELATRQDRVVHQAVTEIQALQADGHLVMVATACEERLARAYLDGIGLADVAVVGSVIEFQRLGMRVTRHNHGAEKVAALASVGIVAPWASAYTDALSDVPILRGSDRPVLVNPDGWLRSRVTRSLGRPAAEVVWLDPPARNGSASPD